MTEAPPNQGSHTPAPVSLAEELESLRRKRAARDGQPGYAANLKAIDARIAEIEAAIAEGASEQSAA